MLIIDVKLYCNFWEDKSLVNLKFFLSNGPCKKDSTTSRGVQKGANFCTTFLLLYHTSGWLNQQNLPKFQVVVYLFIPN